MTPVPPPLLRLSRQRGPLCVVLLHHPASTNPQDRPSPALRPHVHLHMCTSTCSSPRVPLRCRYKDLDGRHAFVSWLTAKYNGPPGSGDATCGRELVRAGLKNLTAKGGMKRAMAWLVRQAPVYDSVPPKPSKSPTPMRRAFRAIAPAPAPDTLPPASAVKGGPAASVPEGRSESWFDSAGKLIAESLGGARRDEAATTLQAVARGRTTRHRGASVGKAEDGLGVAQPTVKPAQAVDIDLDHNDGLSAFARARKMFSA